MHKVAFYVYISTQQSNINMTDANVTFGWVGAAVELEKCNE